VSDSFSPTCFDPADNGGRRKAEMLSVDAQAGKQAEKEQRFLYRIEYRRKHPAIWIAHLDVMRTFERSALRAGLPLFWSSGFNPRPSFEFALPISVGLACEKDPLEIYLTEKIAPDRLASRLEASLPCGFSLSSCFEVEPKKMSLMAAVRQARYLAEAPGIESCEDYLYSDGPLTAERHGRRGRRIVDLRPLLCTFSVREGVLEFTGLAGSRANMRADLLLSALAAAGAIRPELIYETALTRLEVMLDWYS
jgi:radical SAM-linked protein